MGFINQELRLLSGAYANCLQQAQVLDTLKLARNLYPGQRNSLDALCKRLGVENKHRQLHGALLDAELLSDVYLMMTSGQTGFGFEAVSHNNPDETAAIAMPGFHGAPVVLLANALECELHASRLQAISKKSGKTNWVD
jgi:DNA polymerase-3 subunit epsilon